MTVELRRLLTFFVLRTVHKFPSLFTYLLGVYFIYNKQRETGLI